MFCARLHHFVRFNANGSISRCGHMMNSPGFHSFEDMESSDWLSQIKNQMARDQWPLECRRCRDIESSAGTSVRQQSNDKHKILHAMAADYLILGGVLDNICNSACQSCNANLSTKIGHLESKDYPRIDNHQLLDRVPMQRVIEIDLNGGEPSASPNYQALLADLPDNVRVLRVNTNGSRLLPNIENILKRRIHVIITLSLDGTGQVHDYVRWPVLWDRYIKVVDQYRDLSRRHKNLAVQAWTTVSALNINDFENIKHYAKENDLDHSWAFLETPAEINIKFSNDFTIKGKHVFPTVAATGPNNQEALDHFIQRQDKLRGISIKDYQ